MNLNKSIKEQIVNNILAHCFDEKMKNLEKKYLSLSNDIYNEKMNPLSKHINELPKGLMKESTKMAVVFAGKRTYIYFGGTFRTQPQFGNTWEDGRVYRPWNDRERLEYKARHPFAIRRDGYLAESGLLIEERNKLKSKTAGSLEGVRTLKKLLEQWPEVKQFLPDDLAKSQPQALMIPAKELNSIIQKAAE